MNPNREREEEFFGLSVIVGMIETAIFKAKSIFNFEQVCSFLSILYTAFAFVKRFED